MKEEILLLAGGTGLRSSGIPPNNQELTSSSHTKYYKQLDLWTFLDTNNTSTEGGFFNLASNYTCSNSANSSHFLSIPIQTKSSFLPRIILLESYKSSLDQFLESRDACIQVDFLIGTMDDTLYKVSVLLYSNDFLDIGDIVVFESNALAPSQSDAAKALVAFTLIEHDRLILKLFKKNSFENLLLKMVVPWEDSTETYSSAANGGGELEKFLELTPPPPPLLYSISSFASTLSATPSKFFSSLNLTGSSVKGSSSTDPVLPGSISSCTLSFCHIGAGSALLKESRLDFFPSLVFTVSSDAKLRCWDLLSSQIVATHTMSCSPKSKHQVSLTDYGKRVKTGAGGSSCSSNFVTVVAVKSEIGNDGRVLARVFVLYYSPVFFGFSLVELILDLSSTRISYRFASIQDIHCPTVFGRLLDFAICPLHSSSDDGQEDWEMNMSHANETTPFYRLWTLWDRAENSVQYITVQLEKAQQEEDEDEEAFVQASSVVYQWTPCCTFSVPPLSHLSLQSPQNIEKICVDLILKPGYLPLPVLAEALEFPLYSHGESLSREALVAHLYSRLDNGSDNNGIGSESVATIFYRLLHQIETAYRDWSNSIGLETDWGHGVVGVYKRGGLALGVLRPCDAGDLVSRSCFQTCLQALQTPFAGPTDGAAASLTPDLQTKVYLFLTQICGKVLGCNNSGGDGILNPVVLASLEKELVFGLDGCLEGSLDEYTVRVYDSVVAAPGDEHGEQEQQSSWFAIRTQIICLIQQMGGRGQLERVLDYLATSFQHPDYNGLDDQEDVNRPRDVQLNELVMSLIVKSTCSIAEKRRELIKSSFFFLCLIRHICPQYAPSRQLFMRLQSLVCCYWRLHWLCFQKRVDHSSESPLAASAESRFGKLDISRAAPNPSLEIGDQGLLEYLIRSRIGFNPDEFLVSPANAITSAIHSVFSYLGFSRAHALTSLKEAAPIVKLVDSVFALISPAHVVLFLQSLPLATPAVCFLKAKGWLYQDDFQKARYLFEKAVGNDGGECDLQLVIGGEFVNVSSYYVIVSKLCLERGALDLVIHFGKLALATANPENLLTINKMIFNTAINCSDFLTAYECVVTCPDSVIQKDCLQLLISELCEAKELDFLCGGFSFAGMQMEVEKSLHFKTRNEPASPFKASIFQDITYSYFIYSGDFKNAAIVMFLHAVKLYSLTWSDKYGNQEIQSVYTRMSQCLLAALNAISLLEDQDAFIKTPQPVMIFQNGQFEKCNIVRTDDIRRLYQLALAKLVLYPQVSYLRSSFMLPDPQDIYTTYCSLYDTEAALIVASLFEFDLQKVISSSCDVIIRLINNLPCIIPEQEEFTSLNLNPLARAWETLKHLLLHDSASNGWKYHTAAISYILKRLPDFKLPQWLLDSLKNDGELLIRIYLKNNRLEDALGVALSTLANARKPLSSNYRNCSRWIPVTILEQLLVLLKKVDGKGYQSLQVALTNYQPTV